MPKQIAEYRVFLASPGGLDEERQAFRDTLDEYNEMDSRGRGVLFVPIGWEITLGGAGRPQALINQDIEQCDFFLLLLWDRWGSPTGNDETEGFTSGVDEEFQVALDCLSDPAKPMKEVVVFFKAVEPKMLQDPGDQLRKVLRFKRSVEKSRKHLFMTFDQLETLRSTMRQYLAKWVRDHEVNPQLVSQSRELGIIREGVSVWNSWRASNGRIPTRLTYVDLRNAQLAEIDFSGVDLADADFRNADLRGANFSHANLQEARLDNADLTDALLRGANLLGASLRGTTLTRANLVAANLQRANLHGAILGGVDLSRTVVGWTVLASVDLQEVGGLDSLEHHGPSEVSVSTLYKSKGCNPRRALSQFSLIAHCVAVLRGAIGWIGNSA